MVQMQEEGLRERAYSKRGFLTPELDSVWWIHTDTDHWAVRSRLRVIASQRISPFIQATCSTHTWSRPYLSIDDHVGGVLLWISRAHHTSLVSGPLCHFLLSPVDETDEPHEHRSQHPLVGGRTQNNDLMKISQYFFISQHSSSLYRHDDIQLPKMCCCLREETPVTQGQIRELGQADAR